ncbi:MAG: CBS domain-containing protein [Myxococcales bacterium]|nr:CBS domain-containing protein [Myxococcales bacterium]
MRPTAVLGNLKAHKVLDVPSIQLAAAVVGGVGLGALLAAVGAGLHALGEAGLQALSETEGRNAKVAQRVLRDLSAVQSRLLIGRVLCVALAAALVGLSLLQYGAWFALLGVLGTSAAYAIVATVAGAVVRQRSGQATLQLWRWLRPVDLLLTPLAVPLRWINELVMKLVPEVEVEDPGRLAELTVEHVIEQGEETGTIAEEHAQMLRSVLEFKNTVAREIMVPRTQMVAFDIDTTIDDVLASVVESGHSRYPVYRGQIDHVEGILYAKDLFEVLRNKSHPTAVLLTDVLRKPVFFAAESQKIGVLLREMQRRRSHLAVVVDEFGGAAGIVTLEDIVEEIVGEIQDEHDAEVPLVYERAPGHYFVDASISVYDLEEHLGEAICDDKTDFDSLGGMLVHLAGQVPVIGATLVAGSYRVVVLEADERHVRRVEMLRASTEEPKSAAG